MAHFGQLLFIPIHPHLSKDANNSRASELGFLIDVLVSVNEQTRLRPLNVFHEGIEANVNLGVAFVNPSR
jgi:hypothetical protein